MGNSTCQQEIHLNFPCAVPTICIKCVARKYKCQRAPEQARAGKYCTQIQKYTNTHCGRWPTLLHRLPTSPLSLSTSFSLCLCACWYIKAMSCCCCCCTWQLNLHMATVGSRKTHVITLPQLNGVDLLIMHTFTLLSLSSLSLSLSLSL